MVVTLQRTFNTQSAEAESIVHSILHSHCNSTGRKTPLSILLKRHATMAIFYMPIYLADLVPRLLSKTQLQYHAEAYSSVSVNFLKLSTPNSKASCTKYSKQGILHQIVRRLPPLTNLHASSERKDEMQTQCNILN